MQSICYSLEKLFWNRIEEVAPITDDNELKTYKCILNKYQNNSVTISKVNEKKSHRINICQKIRKHELLFD